MSSKPRTPRYWPNMRVRGARRRRQATWHRVQGTFDRISESGRLSGLALEQFARAFVMPPRIMLGVDLATPPQGHNRMMMIPDETTTITPITAADLEDIATALTKEQA